MRGVFASWSHATTPNEFLSGVGRALVDDRHSPHAGRRTELGQHRVGTDGTRAEAGQFVVEKLQNVSARVSLPALPPPDG